MSTRVCARCKIDQPFSDFNKDAKKKHGIRYNCKTCERARMQKYDKSEAGIQRMRASHWKIQGINITFDEYADRYAAVGGKCEICGDFNESLCVDHNHSTGAIRGLLCKPCNIGISALKEQAEVLNNAISYLRRNENAG